jgi:NADH:ubiquinone oxidoreductase subunit F (NADH-binding)
MGTTKSAHAGIFSLSGNVTTSGQYEAPLGVTLRELLDLAGGVRAGKRGGCLFAPGRPLCSQTTPRRPSPGREPGSRDVDVISTPR